MKCPPAVRAPHSLIVTSLLFLLAASLRLPAQSGDWSTAGGGTWSDLANWNFGAGPIADGANSRADFSLVDLAFDATVTLDSERTLGGLIFGDSDPGTAGGWVLGGTSLLTLQNPPDAAFIVVNPLGTGELLNVTAPFGATNGLAKGGSGTLQIGNLTGTYLGGLSVTGGVVQTVSGANYNLRGVTFRGDAAVNSGLSTTYTMSFGAIAANAHTVTVGTGGRAMLDGLTGSGTVTLNVGSLVSDGRVFLRTNWAGFTGTLNLNNNRVNPLINGGGFDSLAGAAVVMNNATIYPRGYSGGSVMVLGALAGTGSLLPDSTAGNIEWQIGAKGLTTVFNGAILNNGKISAVTKQGGGTLTLNGANNYSGATTIAGGALHTTTASTGAGSYTLAPLCGLGVRVAALDSALTNASLTYSGAGTLEVDLGSFGNPSGPVIRTIGNLSVGGIVTVNVKGGNLATGTITLLQCGGTRSGLGSFVKGTLPPRVSATLTDSGTTVTLNITALDSLLAWTGTASADWDTNNAGNLNWLGVPSGTPTYYGESTSGNDGVRFDDSAGGTAAVNLPGLVSPSVFIISNSALAYDFSGDGSVGGTVQLQKRGDGTATINTTNSFVGGAAIEGGLLELGNPGASLGIGTVTLKGDGTLALSRASLGDNNSNPAFANTVSVPTGEVGNLWVFPRGVWTSALTGGGTFNVRFNYTRCDVSGNWSAFTGLISATAFSGTAEFRLSNFQNAGFGRLHLGDGVNLYQNFNPPTGSGTETIQPIGELSGTAGSFLGGNPVSGRFVHWTVGALNTDATFDGTIRDNTGAARITKTGTGTWTVTGDNTYSGGTTVNGGRLLVSNGTGSGTGSGAVIVSAGATLGGTGTIAGVVTNSGTLAPGASIGSLTLWSEPVLTGTVLMEINQTNSPGADQLVVLGTLTYGGTLVVTNLGPALSGPAAFQLFQASAYAGDFTTVTLPPAPSGFGWNTSNLAVDGSLTLEALAGPPPELGFATSGDSLTLSWPGSQLGWTLQSNIVDVAAAASWFDVIGSDTLTNMTLPVNPALPNVFFRLRQ